MSQQQKRIALIAGVVVLILVVWIVSGYNGLVRKQEKVDQTWAEVQSTYQRRLELVPNIVSVVRGVADFEKTTFTDLAEARSRAMSGLGSINSKDSSGVHQQYTSQDSVAARANRLIAVIENYPELRATEAFHQLQAQLSGTERRIKVARNDFNSAVRAYNTSVRSFPTNIVAGLFGFKKREGFQADNDADKAVEIKF